MIRSFTALFLISGLAASGARADVIADWTFETSAPTTAGPYSPEVGSGAASMFHLNTSTYSSPVGNGSSHSYSSNGWSVNDYYQFSVASTGFTNLSLSWDQISSSTGPKDFELLYSTDGTHFTAAGSIYSVLVNASPNTWTSTSAVSTTTFNVDLSSITALNNSASVLFRIVDMDTTSAGGGTVAAAGTDRIDNFKFSGTALAPVPLPAGIWLLGSGLAGLLGARRRRSAAA
jgi:hypothetical protein